MFPHAMLHWEDFGAANAHRILARYAGSCCTFNDDIQGTAAVVLAAALGAVRVAGTPMRDQTGGDPRRGHGRDRDRRRAAPGR